MSINGITGSDAGGSMRPRPGRPAGARRPVVRLPALPNPSWPASWPTSWPASWATAWPSGGAQPRPPVAWPPVRLPELPVPLSLPARWRNLLLRMAGAGAGTVGLFGMVIGAEILAARRRTVLPETEYERILSFPGRSPGRADDAPPLRLAVLGDSTTTGVGTERVEDTYAALAGLALAERGPVEVHVLGRASSRINDVLTEQVPLAAAIEPDLVLLVVGANDATHVTPFREVATGIREILRGLGDRPVVVAGVPRLTLVRLLAPPLRELSHIRGQHVNRILRRAAARRPGTTFVPLVARPPRGDAEFWKGFLAADGFHPSAIGYARWALELVPALLAADPRPVGAEAEAASEV
jgi:lysophospholipase L1-like esterase